MSCGCGCGGGRCASSVAMVRAFDPLVGMCERSRSACVEPVSGMGDILPTIVWPEDVRHRKAEYDPSFQSTNEAAKSCLPEGSEKRAAWGRFFAAWIALRDEEVPWFGAANKYDEVGRFGDQLAGWQEDLKRAGCTLHGPPPPTPKEENEKTIGAIKTVAVAVTAVAVVYGIATVVKLKPW